MNWGRCEWRGGSATPKLGGGGPRERCERCDAGLLTGVVAACLSAGVLSTAVVMRFLMP